MEKYEKQIKHFGKIHILSCVSQVVSVGKVAVWSDVVSSPTGMMRRWDDSQKYLSDNPHLVCEETANYLVIMCIDLEVEEVNTRRNVPHQSTGIPYIQTPLCRLILIIFPSFVETCVDGAGGSSDHCHAVHPGAG